jgi:DNA-binding LacI/PurR family transcriptional regulator
VNTPERGGAIAGTRRRPAGSTDVARLAGVSQKTVSRVMNDEPHVTEQVRQRVLQAAQQLGYRRNNAARTLTSGRTNCIGVVLLGSALYGPSTELVALERAARSTGYAVSVVNTTTGDPGGIAGAVDSLLEQGVDAVVLSEPIDEGPVELELRIPVLALGPAPGVTAPRVITSRGGFGVPPSHEATEHLLSLGHPTVHHVAGPHAWFSARERVDGWRQALREAGAAEPEVLAGDWSVASGYAAGRILAADRAVTAVFAGNDDMAIGVIRAMVEAGRAVPEDVSVVGFDDIPIAAYLNPPLTTVLQPFDEIAEAGLAALVQVLEHPDEPAPVVAQPQCRLVVRSSTAAPGEGRTPA